MDEAGGQRSAHHGMHGPSGEQPDAPSSRDLVIGVVIITIATTLAYSNTFDASFHFDDFRNIVRNESLRDLRKLWPPSGSRWLGTLSFALNYRIGGLDVFGYHVANLLIHAGNGVLVFWLAATTLRTPALRRAETSPLVRRYLPVTSGLLFAVHPVQTQAVTYVVQRYASLATLFFLLALVLYAQARISLEPARASRPRTACLYLLSILCAAAAMKTKEISFTLPLVAAGYELLFFGWGRRAIGLAPLAATAALVPLGLASQGRGLAGVASAGANISRSVYLLRESRVVVTYVRLLLLPFGQNLDPDYRLSHSLSDPGVLFALSLLSAVLATAVFLLVRARATNRATGILVFFGTAWFFVTLSVESSIVPLSDVIAEHRLYLPSAGCSVALATALLAGVERLRLRRSLRAQAAAALLLTSTPLAVATHARNSVWSGDVTLWSDVVAKSPNKARPHNNLGNALLSAGRVEDAVHELRDATRLDPAMAEAHNNLGVAYRASGRADEAIAEFRRSIALDASRAPVHYNVSVALRANGQLDEAARELEETVRLDPSVAVAHDDLGAVHLAMGRLPEALRELREATRLAPSSAGAHDRLGQAYQATGQLDEAVREFREALRVSPGLAAAHTHLASAWGAKGLLDDAVNEYREALRLLPYLAKAHDDLGSAHRARGSLGDAVREYRRAVELFAGPKFVLNLASSLDDAGRSAEAAALYRRYLDQVGDEHPDAATVRARLAQLRRMSPERRSRADGY